MLTQECYLQLYRNLNRFLMNLRGMFKNVQKEQSGLGWGWSLLK